MPKLPSNLDIALARNSLDFLVSLGQEIVSRANQIRAEFPDGTFDDDGDGDGDDEAGEPEELVAVVPYQAAPAVKKKGRPKKPAYQSEGLTQALRDWPKTHGGKLVVREFKAANNFKPNSVDGVVAGLARKGEFVRDKTEPGVLWSTAAD